MKKTLFVFSALLFGVVTFSCDKTELKSEVDENGLVSVVLSSESADNGTRLQVSSGGVTRWSPGDLVTIVDADESHSSREFQYMEETPKTNGAFSGKLRAGLGEQTYYAYHSPEFVECFHADRLALTIQRQNLEFEENGVSINSALYGRYCPMVAIPAVFDAENPTQRKSFQFHHINCLIEASIASQPSDGRLAAMSFDQVTLEVVADNQATPFNTEIHIDMSQIQNDPVIIPYTEGNVKENSMFTSITYGEAKLFTERTTVESGTTCFCLPIFALPTTSTFESTVTVTFYNDKQEVYRLQKHSKTPTVGLRLAGLNVINFDERDII